MKEPVLEFAFSGGIDEATRDEIADAARTFPVLENGRQERRGGYSKRLGYTYLGLGRLDETSRSAGRRLFSHRDQLCTIDGTYLDVYDETAAVSVVRDFVPEAACSLLPVPSVDQAGIPYGVGLVNGYLVLGWIDLSTFFAYAAVLDADTGATVLPPVRIGTGAACENIGVAGFGTTAMVFVSDATANTVEGWYLATANAAGLTAGWVALGSSVGTDFGTCMVVDSLADAAVVAWATNAATGTIKKVDTSGVVTFASPGAVSPSVMALSVSPDQSTVWCAYDQGTTVYGISFDSSLGTSGMASKGDILTVTGATVTSLTIAVTSATAGGVVCNTDDGAQGGAFGKVAGSADATGSMSTWWGTKVVGKAFCYGTRLYAPFSGSQFDSLNICEFTPPVSPDPARLYLRPVAVPVVRGLFSSIGCWQVATSGTKVYFPFLYQTSSVVQSTGCAVLDFASTTRWQAVEHGGVTYLSGGALSLFGGQRVREAGFCTVPGQPTTAQTGTGQTTTLGGWRYVATYSDVDENGVLHVSGVSRPSDATGNFSNKTIQVTTTPLVITARGDESSATLSTTRVDLWRTEDGGSTYYWHSSQASDPTAAPGWNDATADTALRTHALLYGTGALPGTSGSSQDHRAPPGLSCLASYNGMLVGAAGASLWSSSQSIAGEGLWFSPVWETPVDGIGAITALAAQDGTLFVFGRRSVYAVAGEAPSDSAAAGGLGTPRRLAADVGCIDARSVVVTALGVFFQSERGLELLTRGQSVEWVGEQVQETLGAYPVVTSATLDSKHALVRFTCAASETDNAVGATGVHLVYDLTLRTWVSVDKVTNGNNASRAAQSASMVYLASQWRFGWLDTDGRVLVEELPTSVNAHMDLDGFYWVTMAAETANVHIAGLQGEQNIDRILMLAERHTDHDFTIQIAHDYGTSYTESKTFPADHLATLGRQWLDRELLKSTSQAIKVRLSDATPSSGTAGTGKGATWVALAFSGERKSGVKRTTSAQRGS